MNRRVMALGAVLAVAWVGAASLPAQESASVGQLLVEIARARAMAAQSPAIAAASLRAAGFAVPTAGLDQRLTEGRVVEIVGLFGVKVATRSPEAPFDRKQVDSLMAAFGEELTAAADSSESSVLKDGQGADPLEKGKGKKKGLRSPGDPY
jgi:hypothetical protein